MSFPVRISRAALGGKPSNRFRVVNPLKEPGADVFDLLYWTAAGCNVVVPIATVIFDGATAVIQASGEAWDPDGAFVPTVSRTSAGVYVVTYAATYNDHLGVAQTTALKGARATPQATVRTKSAAKVRVDNRTIDVLSWDDSNVATDYPVWLEVY